MDRIAPKKLAKAASAGALAAALSAVLAPAAYAMPAMASIHSPIALAAVQPACNALNADAGPAVPSPTLPAFTTPRAAKSAAILGGEMSALERMRMTQNAPAAEVALDTQAVQLPLIEPAAGGLRGSASLCVPSLSARQPAPALVQIKPVLAPEDFLASKRVRIGKTSFDREWKRVRAERVDSTLRKAFGRRVAPTLDTVGKVNRWVNQQISYVEDRTLFKQGDYWAGARRTLRLRKGDCEDIALTKMQMLAAAGFDRDRMYLTIARDRVRNADHALLIVEVEGRFVVLDNATDEVLDGALSHDYAPLLSFNSKSAWLHGY